MRNVKFVTDLKNAIAERNNSSAQKIIEAYVKDQKGDYTHFKNDMINQIKDSIDLYYKHFQNLPPIVTEFSESKVCCALVVTCVAATTCPFSSYGSCISALLCGTSSYFLCKDAIVEEMGPVNRNEEARLLNLENSAENLFKICDDYCNKYPLKNQQPLNPISHSAPSL